MLLLRANSPVRTYLGPTGTSLLEWCLSAYDRLLPHAELERWTEIDASSTSSVWTSSKRTKIRVTIDLSRRPGAPPRSLQTTLRRRNVPKAASRKRRALDNREHDICHRIAHRTSAMMLGLEDDVHMTALRSARTGFDEQVIAEYIAHHHQLDLDVADTLEAAHRLAEQTYENKALTMGVLLDPMWTVDGSEATFPEGLFDSKKYKALSDGYRTAYHVSRNGHVLDFLDLERFAPQPLSAQHFYPEWTRFLARASRQGRCGIALSRQGDLVVLDEGTMRLTYRYGRWQYWNHAHILDLMKNRTRAQHVPPATIGKVIASVYRAALDVSFRRSGGLFVVLHNRKDLQNIVRRGDELGNHDRTGADENFDNLLRKHTIYALPRSVIVELASLDGATVVDNSGHIRAYGAVLRPRKQGSLHGTEGSRTKAAIGASNYGLAVKVSADGDITIYHDGDEFLRV